MPMAGRTRVYEVNQSSFFRKMEVCNATAHSWSISKYARPETAGTNFTYDMDDPRNIYRHPDRQGPPSIRFS